MDRRTLMKLLATGACSAAAHPLLSTVTLANTDGGPALGENRLVVVILRGAQDGLDLVRPSADPLFAQYRPTLSQGQGLDLDGYFSLSPHLGQMEGLWRAGHLGFVHATSTPYRDGRSHVEGQDLLEAGTGLDLAPEARREGWLNRLLQSLPGLQSQTAYAVGPEATPLLQGKAPAANWSPEMRLKLSAQSRLLLEHIYHDDPLFRDAAAEAIMLTQSIDLDTLVSPMDTGQSQNKRLGDIDSLVTFTSQRLREDTRIAALSLSGWDTHRNQNGLIVAPMQRLQRLVLQLQAGLGDDVWGKTVLLAMTEFGRTVAENGSQGTDHGTGGAMLMAGGALNGGKLYGRWPGLEEAALYDRRDLMPTSDVRAWAAWVMRGLYGLDQGLLQDKIFPGLHMSDDPRILA